jgi:hypothetical protein
MLFVFGSLMEVVATLHRGIGRKYAKRERYRCDREDLGKNLVRPRYKNTQNFHGHWYLKITGRRTSSNDGLCMYCIKNCDNFLDETTPILLALHVCRC